MVVSTATPTIVARTVAKTGVTRPCRSRRRIITSASTEGWCTDVVVATCASTGGERVVSITTNTGHIYVLVKQLVRIHCIEVSVNRAYMHDTRQLRTNT